MMSKSNRLVRPDLVANHVANISNSTNMSLAVPTIDTIETLDVSDLESLKSRWGWSLCVWKYWIELRGVRTFELG